MSSTKTKKVGSEEKARKIPVTDTPVEQADKPSANMLADAIESAGKFIAELDAKGDAGEQERTNLINNTTLTDERWGQMRAILVQCAQVVPFNDAESADITKVVGNNAAHFNGRSVAERTGTVMLTNYLAKEIGPILMLQSMAKRMGIKLPDPASV